MNRTKSPSHVAGRNYRHVVSGVVVTGIELLRNIRDLRQCGLMTAVWYLEKSLKDGIYVEEER